MRFCRTCACKSRDLLSFWAVELCGRPGHLYARHPFPISTHSDRTAYAARFGIYIQQSGYPRYVSRISYHTKVRILTFWEAISEGVAAEVAQFGIRVLLAIPGGFRTSQLSVPYTTNHPIPAYNGYRERIMEAMEERWKHAQGDPEKAMEVLVDVIKGEGKAEGKVTPDWLLRASQHSLRRRQP